MLTLYYAPGSSSFATHIALNEVGAAFDAKPISLAHKEQNQSNYLATTAAGKVPTLMPDGQPLTEVAGILF
jgi:glutathione S-transferase